MRNAIGLAGLAVLLCATGARADATSGTLVARQGDVRVTPPGGAEGPGQVGQALPPGTNIRTGANGSAEVRFADDSSLKMQGGSQLQLSAVKRSEKKTSIVLFFGRIWSKVTHASDGAVNFDIKTPNAVAGVRGTEFTTTVADDGSARVAVQDGQVAVSGDKGNAQVGPSQQVDADDQGVASAAAQGGAKDDAAWQQDKAKRLRTQAPAVVEAVKAKIMARKSTLETLRAQQQDIQAKLQQAKDANDAAQVRTLAQKLASLGDVIADLGDEADSSFGLVDHFADLAKDKRFGNINRKTLEADAAALRRVKADLDKTVREGTDMSVQAMNQMMKDMQGGKPTLKEKNGSAKELFDDEMMK